MKQHTSDFLATLLWVADGPDLDERPLANMSIYDFSDAFVEAVEKFIDAFLDHLVKIGYDTSLLGKAERSLGGNVFLSLSGHGCGFFDDNNEDIAALHDVLKTWAGSHRFEELEHRLWVENGKIDLDVKDEFLAEARAKMFSVKEAQND